MMINMKQMSRFFCLVLLLCTAWACSDFIEEDIEDDVLVLLGPGEGVSTETQSPTFWWDELKDATHYRLQIARPNFKDMEALELDTLITSTKFLHTLFPSDFEWRVRAENSGYQTVYTKRTLTILVPTDITKQKVVLALPAANAAINNKNVNFTWDALSIAHNYTFEIKKDSWDGENVDDAVVTDKLKLSMELEEGKYVWGVLATDIIKAKSTPYATRTFYVDLTAPDVPVLTSPAKDASVTGLSQEFQWTYTEENELTAVSFTLQIASDKDANNIVKEIALEGKTYTYTFTETGTYYWRIKAVDKANNESAFSEINKFSLSND